MRQIEHVIVLMMENRSFDHMLGYLSIDGIRPEIRGLNKDYYNTYNGKKYHPYRINTYKFKPDPGHGSVDVNEQLQGGNGGFINNFSKYNNKNPEDIMGYFNKLDLPVFHDFSENFCVCDQWFSSVRGATQPNRAYAYAGTSEGHADNILPKFFTKKTIFQTLGDAGVHWNFYSHDIASLRFNKNHHWSGEIDKVRNFYDRCKEGNLAPVSWIDPDFGIGPTTGNDDHPPHNIQNGQHLIGGLYNAILSGKDNLWEKTLFIVTYDEHGGFYDHVVPPPAEDEYENFRQYGVRVPAFVISPYVNKRSVCHDIFDHTTIIKTIYERFCGNLSNDYLDEFGARVKNAKSLWHLLQPNLRTGFSSLNIGGLQKEKLDVTTDKSIQNDFQKSLIELRKELIRSGVKEEDM